MTRSRMKFRRMREVYWLLASASVTKTIDNMTSTEVIIELPTTAMNRHAAELHRRISPSGPSLE